MLFWRAKAQKQATEAAPADQSTASSPIEAEGASPAPSGDADNKTATEAAAAAASATTANAAVGETSNVVTLPSSRLTDRLHDITSKTTDRPAGDKPETLASADLEMLPGQARAYRALQNAAAEVRSGFNILVLGAAGTGRRTAAMRIAQARAAALPPPKDWVYVANAADAARFEAFALAHGEGSKLVREVRSAVAKSAAMLDRIIASDDHRLSIDVLEEEHRHRHEHALDSLRRRAEAQNIALVKTADGFVLAPMHEGKVVRSDVFRALPESLQREVEDKITALEAELNNLVIELPSHEIATDDKHAALARETALRAIKPNLGVTRKVFSSSETAGEILNVVESGFITRATARVRHQSREPVEQAFVHALVRSDDEIAGQAAPVVLARDLTPAKLSGVIGHDASGRLTIRPGHLMRANGGFLIVEAWRLAANPAGWDSLSTALESGVITPETAPDFALEAEPVPLSIKIILIADDGDWKKLLALDPGIARHFPAVVRFAATAPDADVSEDEFAAVAAATAKAGGLRPLAREVSSELYKDAKRRAGSADAISLDLVALSHILIEADISAGADNAPHIRAVDIEAASRHHQQSRPAAS